MSVQNLLNLITPRGGQVDPKACMQCAQLRKKIVEAADRHDAAAADAAVQAMDAHMTYGHPDDMRRPSDRGNKQRHLRK
ncbi:hypothetical protein [Streptomyces zagrosensis]|uniref:DUF2786 domain-containing protein n=1 Tax=Streptomyces zagrosensis TaxID=1042984 RepID=A0A7W9QGW3_9ACTN|nr:hypothetical protein [Streptomyces zagrosensis]MBB5938797.1 hypothetical protein [Streptomyces zagrosensis]